MSEATFNPDGVDDFLAHYGVKGMKWGQRKERGKLRRAATKANVALDAGSKVIEKGEEKLLFLPYEKRNQAASNTQGRVLGEARRINKDPQFKGKDIKNDPALKKKYHDAVKKKAADIYAEELGIARTEAIVEFIDAAVGGRRAERMDFKVDRSRIRHADLETVFALDVTRDGLGHISDMSVIDTSIKQGEDFEVEATDEFLAHFGVKGMKWGVRRTRAERRAAREAPSSVTVNNKTRRSGSQDITVRNKAGKGVGKVTGGKRNLATEEAIMTQVARQKARKSTTDSLSNVELKAAVERMRLEQQFKELEKKSGQRRKGKAFLDALFNDPDMMTAIGVPNIAGEPKKKN